MIVRYASRREAAIAALKSANEAATTSRGPERPLGLFLLAARRDPSFATALYDVGIMCTRQERWDDALNFYKEAAKLDKTPELGRLIQAEMARVQLIGSLESTPEGRRTREFYGKFVTLVARSANTVGTLDEAQQIEKADANRWELQSIVGSLQARLGKYDESAKALDAAAKLAPAERRKALTSAADLVRREATFEEQLRTANENWDKQQYSPAAQAYANAWETSPARDKVGMQAAAAFLMADQIPLAVQTLAKLRDTGGPDLSAKATLMLKELGAVSQDAKQMAQVSPGGARPESTADVGERVQTLLGDLTSAEMQLAAKENPALVRDETSFVAVADEELSSNTTDALLLSTQSVFQMYRRAIPAETPLPGSPADLAAPPPPAGGLAPVSTPDGPPVAAPAHPQRLETRPTTPPEPDHAALFNEGAHKIEVIAVARG
jgi:tetratricopeptide (TPR) repeat protein